MTGYRNIFLDTAPFIYYIEEHEKYFERVKDFFASINDERLITSVVSYEEYCVGALKYAPGKIAKMEAFLESMNIELMPINKAIALKAAETRSKNSALKGMDALQIGTAFHSGCDLFVTNDKRLSRVEGIDFLLIENM